MADGRPAAPKSGLLAVADSSGVSISDRAPLVSAVVRVRRQRPHIETSAMTRASPANPVGAAGPDGLNDVKRLVWRVAAPNSRSMQSSCAALVRYRTTPAPPVRCGLQTKAVERPIV